MAKQWIPISSYLPERGKVVETKIDDEKGERNVQLLKLHKSEGSSLWFFPDDSMYVYYTPTHWSRDETPNSRIA